jgi:hypothetical protein
MYSRVTLLEIDTVRISLEDAVGLFEQEVLPGLRAQEGYEGVLVLATPEGRGMIVTIWASEEAAADPVGFAAGALQDYMMLFKSAPGREYYRVALAELPPVTVR